MKNRISIAPGRRILSTSLVKGIRLLEAVTNHGEIGVSDLARLTGINKSNVHRILSTLETLGYVEKDTKNLKYKTTLKVFQLGSRVIEGTGLREVVVPFLKELGARFGETANLGVLDGGEVVYIEKVESSEVLRMDLSVGRSVPAYCTALGKVLLADLGEEELKVYLDNTKMAKKTFHEVPDRDEFLRRLGRIREQGYAVDRQELDIGITCIAAPVRNHTGRVVAAVSVAGPSTRMTDDKLEEITTPLMETTLAISRKLGLAKESYAF
jgi:DNA-binding IclR family transcriptional regulator